MSDRELVDYWLRVRQDLTTGPQFSHRGWYHALYSEAFAGKKILDVGCGLGVDSLTFAQHGARVTFLDIVESNLVLVKRLCELLALKADGFVLLKNLEDLENLDRDFDVILALGSLHHAPFEVVKPEVDRLVEHIKIGGRWLQLAYPKSRWNRDGRPPFSRWGQMTDGQATPWAEWYDLPKIRKLMEPARLDAVLVQEFHNGEFIWFDLFLRHR